MIIALFFVRLSNTQLLAHVQNKKKTTKIQISIIQSHDDTCFYTGSKDEENKRLFVLFFVSRPQ